MNNIKSQFFKKSLFIFITITSSSRVFANLEPRLFSRGSVQIRSCVETLGQIERPNLEQVQITLESNRATTSDGLKVLIDSFLSEVELKLQKESSRWQKAADRGADILMPKALKGNFITGLVITQKPESKEVEVKPILGEVTQVDIIYDHDIAYSRDAVLTITSNTGEQKVHLRELNSIFWFNNLNFIDPVLSTEGSAFDHSGENHGESAVSGSQLPLGIWRTFTENENVTVHNWLADKFRRAVKKLNKDLNRAPGKGEGIVSPGWVELVDYGSEWRIAQENKSDDSSDTPNLTGNSEIIIKDMHDLKGKTLAGVVRQSSASKGDQIFAFAGKVIAVTEKMSRSQHPVYEVLIQMNGGEYSFEIYNVSNFSSLYILK